MKTLFGELIALKRIRSAGHVGSIASRLFREAWQRLANGEEVDLVARKITAQALAATRLGDIDAATLAQAGLERARIETIFRDAVRAVASEMSAHELRDYSEAFGVDWSERSVAASLPDFVEALELQPRAGVTCPDRPRIILEPAESHAEHCLVVAVLGALLAPRYGASRETVFLAGLAHHFHNAGLPDSGFTGEVLLGDDLGAVMNFFTDRALRQLDQGLRDQVEEARRILPDANSAAGRAFHAADTIDRVMEIAQHLERATLTMSRVLGEMALVHDGPVKNFQDRVLTEMELL